MNNEKVAEVARRLAEALQDFAYSRKEDDKKRVAELKYELIRTVRQETAENV